MTAAAIIHRSPSIATSWDPAPASFCPKIVTLSCSPRFAKPWSAVAKLQPCFGAERRPTGHVDCALFRIFQPRSTLRFEPRLQLRGSTPRRLRRIKMDFHALGCAPGYSLWPLRGGNQCYATETNLVAGVGALNCQNCQFLSTQDCAKLDRRAGHVRQRGGPDAQGRNQKSGGGDSVVPKNRGNAPDSSVNPT